MILVEDRQNIAARIEQGSENDDVVQLICADSREVSETVIFPILPLAPADLYFTMTVESFTL